jgi:hypothetical protein
MQTEWRADSAPPTVVALRNPREFADALERLPAGEALVLDVPRDATDEERATTRAFLEDVAQVLDGRGHAVRVHKTRWRSGGEN